MASKWDKYKLSSATPSPADSDKGDRWSKYKLSSEPQTIQEQPKKQSLIDKLGLGELGQLNIERVEKTISERPKIAQEFIKSPPTLQTLREHPFLTPLKTLGAGMQLAESIPANIGLALQRIEPEDIIPDVMAGLRGERPAELGDIFRGAGVPEPVAATGGLLASGYKFMPTEILGKSITKTIATITQLPKFISKLGKPFVGKTLSVLSGVPEDDVVQAIDNPEFLSGRFIAREKPAVEKLYQTIVKPEIQKASNIVNLAVPEVTNNIKDITLKTPAQELTRLSTTMKKTELSKVEGWLSELQKSYITLNKLDAMIGEIDEGLQRVYKAYERGKLEPVTRTFEGVALQIRRALKSARNKQYPELSEHIDRYANLKTAERVYQSFDRWQPRLLNAVTATALAGLFGVSKPVVYGAAVSSTIPKLQGLGIRGASQLGREVASSSAIPLLGVAKSRQ